MDGAKKNPLPWLNAVAGGLLGLLVGLLLGLSVEHLVGEVIGGLVALVLAFFGIRGHQSDSSAVLAPRLIGFAGCCLIAILGGIYIRAHDLLSISPAEQIEQWTKAGFAQEQARQLATFQILGLMPAGWTLAEGANINPQTRKSVLMSVKNSDGCADLEARRFNSLQERRTAFVDEGGGWKVLAQASAGMPDEQLSLILDATWRAFCPE